MTRRMPSGVLSPRMVASQVGRRKPVLAKETWDTRSRKKAMERKELMDRARTGDPKAVKRLWVEYRCRIYTETTGCPTG